jgi:hypothetical protein
MSLSITRALETYAEKAAAMLAHLTGKSLMEIEDKCVTREEIFQQLGSITAYLEEVNQMLHWRHNASSETNVEGDKLEDKLATHGIVEKKKPFLGSPKDQIKLNLNILLARLGRHIMIHGNNNTNLTSINSGQYLETPKSKVVFNNLENITRRFTTHNLQKEYSHASITHGGGGSF